MTPVLQKELGKLLDLEQEIIKRYPSAVILAKDVIPANSYYIRFWDLESDRIVEYLKVGDCVKTEML